LWPSGEEVKEKNKKPLNARARAREKHVGALPDARKGSYPEQKKQPFVKFAFRKTGILNHFYTENTSGVKIAFKKRRKRRGTIQEKP